MAFENPCGRRGCGHIFKYSGSNPFQDLAALVAEHAPYCVGRESGATHRCDTGWQPNAVVLDRFYQVDDDPNMYYNFGQCPSMELDEDRPKSLAGYSDSDSGDSEPESDIDSEDEVPLASISALTKRKTSKSCARRTSCVVKASAKGTTTALPKLLVVRKKKGARTEAQRRALLEADPWTVAVAPHHVICRGCTHTIRLDKRSRYYPGLWEKHRERCEGVKTACPKASSSPHSARFQFP
ncbi:hypothetical protein B0H19DRAFT_1071366 [Mycena capillaripes]|nr:hypothetical protein B0H19DRAFT_1071366 [Mycena capillaripes]